MNHELKSGAEPVAGYTLIERLGKGGFGEVWKANGPGGFQVALKFVSLGENVGSVELRALEVIKGVRHPHLLGTFGSWQDDGQLIIAMELADKTLLDRFREAVGQGFAGIPEPEIFEHFLDAAKALDYLNEPRQPAGGNGPLGIQHRDVKPQNLLLVGGSVKVADFGLARVLENSVTGHTGSLTPSYAAPEFFDRKTSSQSDQYSLAVTYCHLRGGRLPFEGNPAAVMAGHMLREPDLSMIPEAERPAVARALSKSPRDRWPSCRAFIQAVMDPTTHGHAPPTVAPVDSEWKRTTQADTGPALTLLKPERFSELDPILPDSPSNSKWPYLVGATVLAVALLLLVGLFVGSSRHSVTENETNVAKVPIPPSPPNPGAPPTENLTPVQSHIESGLAFLAKEVVDKAVAEFDEAIRLDPKSAVAFAGRSYARGLAPGRIGTAISKKAAWSKRRQDAEGDCDEALRLDPNLALAHAARGMALTLGAPQDFTQAMKECDEAIQLKPDSALVHLARAHVLSRRGSREDQQLDLKAATKTSNRAISLDSKLVAAYYLRGSLRLNAQNYDAAMEDFEEAHRLDPDNPQAYVQKGMVWKAKGDNDRAIHQFNLAIQKSPDFMMAYGQRAAAFEAKGDNAKAEADRETMKRLRGPRQP
jgi:serine/threonine protein kinase/Flp pilus assembly protein TadD